MKEKMEAEDPTEITLVVSNPHVTELLKDERFQKSIINFLKQ